MINMVIAVIGLGSMGKRRIRLIQDMYSDYEIVGIDSRQDRRVNVAEQFGIICYENLDSVSEELDCVFICTSPLSHNSIIHQALCKGLHVFTELNLVPDGYEESMKLAAMNSCTLFLSSTFLYREETRYIRKKVMNESWNYIYHIGQYLPDWHPWENYQDFFLGDKRTNGCREILSIELPWLIESFGNVIEIKSTSDKMTSLNIDYKDNFMLQLVHKNGSKGSVIVDVVSPVAVRKLEVYKENRYISWNGTPDTVYEFDSGKKKLERVILHEDAEHIEGYSSFIVENAYRNEIKEFFDVIFNNKKQLYSFEKDLTVLHLIDSIGA